MCTGRGICDDALCCARILLKIEICDSSLLSLFAFILKLDDVVVLRKALKETELIEEPLLALIGGALFQVLHCDINGVAISNLHRKKMCPLRSDRCQMIAKSTDFSLNIVSMQTVHEL